jgi:phosphoribosylamine--glycine ligase/phosphoribosylformylglycinamidine cyclo-ligase
MAARMEGSKAFSKDFMRRHDIPTAAYRTFTSEKVEEAKQYIRSRNHKVVLKASGLAAGKGVLLPSSIDEAVKELDSILVDRVFGEAGEECRPSDFALLLLIFSTMCRLGSSN